MQAHTTGSTSRRGCRSATSGEATRSLEGPDLGAGEQNAVDREQVSGKYVWAARAGRDLEQASGRVDDEDYVVVLEAMPDRPGSVGTVARDGKARCEQPATLRTLGRRRDGTES